MKPIKNYENYLISKDGETWSIKSNIFLKPAANDRGYKTVSISSNGKAKTFKVHRLVALAFVPNPNNYNEVNHIDGDKFNNKAENLEWCSRSQNIAHSYKLNLRNGINAGIAARAVISKPVIDINTGVFYDSILDASKYCNFKYKTLAMYLNGSRKNKTSLRYA